MKGWHYESYRHSLAARGMRTGVRLEPFPSYYNRSGSIQDTGGRFYLDLDGEEIGRIDIALHQHDTGFPFERTIPTGTAVVSSIEIYEDEYKKQGFGRKLIEEMEEFARKSKMNRVWVLDVRNVGFFERMGYTYTGVDTIYEKVLK